MQILSLGLKNVGPFVDVDFKPGGNQLIAICGPNGSGKTTLLECLLVVPFHGKFAFTGELPQDKFPKNDLGIIENTFRLGGKRYRSVISGTKGKTPEYVLYADDVFVAGPNRKAYLSAIKDIYPYPLEVTLSTCFANQGDIGGIFRSPPSARGAILGEILGLAAYDRLMTAIMAKAAEIEKSIPGLPENPVTVDMIESCRASEAELERQIAKLRGQLGESDGIRQRLIETLGPELATRQALLGNEESILKAVESSRAELAKIWQDAEREVVNHTKDRSALEGRILRMEEDFSALRTVDLSNPMCQDCALTSHRHTFVTQKLMLQKAIDDRFVEHVATIANLNGLSRLAQDRLGEEVFELTRIRERLKDLESKLPMEDFDQLVNAINTGNKIREEIGESGVAKSSAQANREYLERDYANQELARGEISKHQLEVGDFRLLFDITRQEKALETARLIPEITEKTNDFLGFFPNQGLRLEFVPVKVLSDGSQKLEITPVLYKDDVVRPHPSGGELAIFGECLRTAICVVRSREGGGFSVVCRDETTAALDIDNQRNYVSMLRGAIAAGKLNQLFFVSHNIDPTLADLTVQIVGGMVATL